MKKNILFLFAFIIIACNCKSYHSHSKGSADINYKKDTIIISFEDSKETYVAKDGKFFTEDGYLFLSNSDDTIIVVKTGILPILYKIKADSINNSYITACYIVNNNDSAVLLSQYFYDKNYKIKKIDVPKATDKFTGTEDIPLSIHIDSTLATQIASYFVE